jgi:hypothetical protein
VRLHPGRYSDPVSILLGVREAPSGSMELSGGAAVTATRAVTVDAGVAEATEMRVRNAGGEWSGWSIYVHKAPWSLTGGDGLKTVEAEYRNALGTIARSDSILRPGAAALSLTAASPAVPLAHGPCHRMGGRVRGRRGRRRRDHRGDLGQGA